MYSAKDSGPIGLSLMVTVADIWMSHTLDEALKIASEKNIRHPKLLKKYVDDILAIFRRQPLTGQKVVEDFLTCLNQVHHRVQFTIEYEQNNSIAFLDCHIKRLDNGKLTTTVYRKPSDTNLVMRPKSCQNPDTVISTFKGFLCRAHRLCSTPELLKQEINCLLDKWEDNSHDRKMLQKIADTYKPPPLTAEPSSSYPLRQTAARQQRQQQTQSQTQSPPQQQTSTKKQQIVLPFVPGLSPAIRRILKKAGIVSIFTPGPSLQNILCAKNKTKFPPRQVVYKLSCDCKNEVNNAYIGKTTRKAKARMAEHQGYIRRGEWNLSGIAAHKENCPNGNINFNEPEILAKIQAKSKRQADFKLDYMESLMIKLHQTGPGHGFNEDEGRRVRTKQWDPLLIKLRKTMGLEKLDSSA